MEKKVKFGVFADAHADIMHDVEERLKVFLDACRKEKVDFIIQLGDFCRPDKIRDKPEIEESVVTTRRKALQKEHFVDKDKIVSAYKNFEKPSYHVIGNHDCDVCSKQELLNFYGVNYKPYYSFDFGGFHFVVLDNNNYIIDGKEYDYERGNYFQESRREKKLFPYVPQAQLAWLKDDLAKTENPTIVFSHYALESATHDNFSDEVKQNASDVMSILNSAPSGVYMSMYGHTHHEDLYRVGKIWHYSLNSLSNCWLGTAYPCLNRYTPEIDEKFPNIRYVAPYKDAVFAIVELGDDGAMIKGVRSEFVGKTPEELGKYTRKDSGWTKTQRPCLITPNITDRFIPFMK